MQAFEIDRLADEIARDPRVHRALVDAVRLHGEHRADPGWLGFEAADVHSRHHVMECLLERGVLDMEYRSRSRRAYKLADIDGVMEALRVAVATAERQEVAPERYPLPADLFDVVVGLQEQLEVLRAALEAERPVHVLMEGPPAGAKSLILSELERLPGARRVLGATTSRAGVVGYLLGDTACTCLLIDELEDMDGRELSSVLNGLMAEGRVERLQHGRTEQQRRDVWVMATCNSADRLRPALLSRFVRLRLPAYGEGEFRQVALQVLVRREDADPELAAEIAEAVAPHTHDVRDAVKVCRLCHGERRRVADLVRQVLAKSVVS